MRPQPGQLVSLLFFIVLFFQLDAQKISIQGTLKDINGKAIPDGTSSVTFKLYSVATGGSVLWNETANVTVKGGVYSYYLGSTTPLSAADYTGPRWLGITVSGSELSPRTELSYAPYAMSVAAAQSLANNGGTAIFESNGDLTLNKGFNMENGKQLYAKNTAGTLESFLRPRWTDDIMYMQMGSAGFNLRNNGSTSRLFIDATGNTGIGTTSPANRLDVEGGLAVGATYSGTSPAPSNGAIIEGDVRIGLAGDINGSKVTINANDPQIQFVDNNSATSRGFINMTGANLKIGTNSENTTGSFIVRTNGGDRFFVDKDGRVGIGTANPAAPLDIDATTLNTTTASLNRSYFNQANSPTSVTNNTNTSSDIAVRADGWFWAATGGFVSTSDKRIKNITGLTKNADDLEAISKIQITDYTYIDKVANVDGLQKKVIAQQVNEVYPLAVKKNKGIIPNVYQLALKVIHSQDATEITSSKVHDFKAGDVVKLMIQDAGVREVVVTKIIDPTTFVTDKIEGDNIFIYGKHVDDLLTIDYDALSMLNISATQELYKKIIALEAENKDLKSINAAQQSTNVSLEQRLDKLESIIKTIDFSSVSINKDGK